MATAENIEFENGGDTIRISGLELHDDEVVEYFQDVPDEDREDMVGRAVEIGVTAMRLMDTSKEVEYVDRRIGELEDEIEDEIDEFKRELEQKLGEDGHVDDVLDEHLGDDGRMHSILDDHVGDDGKIRAHLEEAFSDDGLLKERLDEELGEDGEKIKAALDPDREGTPTYRLKRAFLDEIGELRDEIVEQETEEEMRSRTHFKGDDFETSVENILGELVYQTNNELEYTGDTGGELPGRDVGDFVLTLGDTGQRIVIEAKTERYSKPDIQDEMQDAIQNRNADYGIFVSDHLGNVPDTKIGWFNEFNQEFVSVVLSETNEEDLEPGFLRMAFDWARMRAVNANAEVGDAFDPNKLQDEIDEIEDAISRFRTIRGQCTEIEKSKNRIEEQLSDIENDVTQRLTTIEAELRKASDAG
jgi:hypothetical protein